MGIVRLSGKRVKSPRNLAKSPKYWVDRIRLPILATFRYYCYFYGGSSDMTQTSLPEYAHLDQALEQTELKMHPSQVHGLICGLLCGNPQTTPAWEELVTGGAGNTQAQELLDVLQQSTAKQLDEFLFELEMLLPTDEEALPMRAEALTLWCQGLLTGLKIAGVPVEGRKPGELTEAINDIAEIAKMNYEQVVASEEDEEAYTELVEFVRMAVILIYQDLREQEGAAQTKSTASPLQ